MATNKKISDLPSATLPLTGSELVEIVQGGINKQVDSSEVGGGGVSDWGDIGGTLSNQTDLQTALDAKAPLASPIFTGTPAAPTASAGTSTTQIATTAFVDGGYARKFAEAAIAYVDSGGSDVTGTIGRADLPYATIAGALDANTGVTNLKIKIGMGTFASPVVAKTRSNLWIDGSGKPGYNGFAVSETAFGVISITDPTALMGGTILQGELYFLDKNNVHLSNFGVDCGSAFVTGGGTEANQIAFLSATSVVNFPLMENITIHNVSTLGRTASSAFHAIQLENCYRPIVDNCDTYFSTHGIVFKNYGGIINNVRCHKHTLDGIILKSNSYAFGLNTIVSNFEIQGGGGLFIHTETGTVGYSGANISNGTIRGTTYGVKTQSDIASPNSYLTLHSIKALGVSGIGFDIANVQSSLFCECYALSCTGDGFNVVVSSTNTLTQFSDCHAEGCVIGFDVSATSSSVYLRDCRSRSNSSHGFNASGNVFGWGNVASGNSGNAVNGTINEINLTTRTFFGGTSTPSAIIHINSGAAAAGAAPLKIAAGPLNTTAEFGAFEYGPDLTSGSFYLTKASNLRHGIGGVIYDSFADVNNSGTSETDMFSYTTPASTLAANGEKLRGKYAGTFNDNTSTAQMKVLFDGVTVFDSGALTIANTGFWEIDVLIVRTGSTTARSIVTMTTDAVTVRSYTTQTDLTGLTLTNTSILKLTATAGGGGGGNNDITGKLATVSWFPVAAN